MKTLTALLLMLPFLSFAQEKGMHFEHGTTWSDILAKAKTENKYIFVDCFTTWCGPCRYMSANIFPQEEVGEFMNEKFLNVKLQLDTTDADNDEVKKWYQDAHDIMTQFKIRAFPTYLYFDPNGNAVHRLVGGMEAKDFITNANNALNTDKQYYTLLNKYEKGKKDSASLVSMALAARSAYDMETARKIADEYLATQTNLFTKDNLEFIQKFTESSSDKGFKLFLNNPEKTDAVLGAPVAEKVVKEIILYEEVFPIVYKKDVDPNAEPDWNLIKENIEKKYPGKESEILLYSKVNFYLSKKNWEKFFSSVSIYLNNYKKFVSNDDLNQFAWSVFLDCNDRACLNKALDWSNQSFKGNNGPGYIDTYANLLYKLGRKDEAIAWEEKAKGFAAEKDKQGYQDVIDKMKKGEKTWN